MFRKRQIFRFAVIFVFLLDFSVVESFSNMKGNSRRSLSNQRCPTNDSSLFQRFATNLESAETNLPTVLGQPPYSMAGLDLSSSWIGLVKDDKVKASMSLSSGSDTSSTTTVEYGIRAISRANHWIFEEYVHEVLGESSTVDPKIAHINATLVRTQQDANGLGVVSKMVGNFVAQLQLVRTLRPPPSEGFLEATTSKPPQYNPDTDSFVNGPLRLELRPLVGRLDVGNTKGSEMNTPWDVFHNISPADRRGHFLLLPSLSHDEQKNWRGQEFTPEDCHDLVQLASSVHPAGSIFIGYNSVGAGASQNHIHCHSWPYPTHGLESAANEGEAATTKFEYAVSSVGKLYDFYDLQEGKVEVSYLNYPVFCIQMSASLENLDLLAKALATSLEAIGEAPHNIGFLNKVYHLDDDDDENHDDTKAETSMVEVFLFVRSKERSSILPSLKLGISEMMGIFHAQSEEELESLTAVHKVANADEEGPEFESSMEKALADVSYENDEELWEGIVANLQGLETELS